MEKASVCCLTKYIEIRGAYCYKYKSLKSIEISMKKAGVLLDKIMIFRPLNFVIYYTPNNIGKLYFVKGSISLQIHIIKKHRNKHEKSKCVLLDKIH